jgi:hypothetical protein
VVEAVRRARRAILLALTLLGGDDRLEVPALATLLASVAIGSLRNLLRLADGGLLDVGAVHRGPGVLAVGSFGAEGLGSSCRKR